MKSIKADLLIGSNYLLTDLLIGSNYLLTDLLIGRNYLLTYLLIGSSSLLTSALLELREQARDQNDMSASMSASKLAIIII